MPIPHLYIHIPFCASKCHYCAFNSYAGENSQLFDRYIAALKREWNERGSRSLETIYVGGGTPSVLSGPQIHDLLTTLTREAGNPDLREFTVEVNPGNTTPSFLEGILASGVDRVSMGVQTMDARRLKKLGRVHTPGDVRESVSSLRKAGIKRISLDLIYGQPEQTLSEWIADVKQLLELSPDHLSLYALQYEEGTVYTQAKDRGKLAELEDHIILRMFEAAKDLLADHGFQFYELSNASKPGEESLHNIGYWKNRPYVGLGAGAYGGLGHLRYRNECAPEAYIDKVLRTGTAVVEEDPLDEWATYLECLSSGLRMMEGIDLQDVERRTGLNPAKAHASHVHKLLETGLAELKGQRLSLTWDGLWLLDTLMLPFLEAPDSVPA